MSGPVELRVFGCQAAHAHDPKPGGECWWEPSMVEIIEWLESKAQPSKWGMPTFADLLGSLRVAETGGDIKECWEDLRRLLGVSE